MVKEHSVNASMIHARRSRVGPNTASKPIMDWTMIYSIQLITSHNWGTALLMFVSNIKIPKERKWILSDVARGLRHPGEKSGYEYSQVVNPSDTLNLEGEEIQPKKGKERRTQQKKA